MLRFLCDERLPNNRLTRREWLRVCGLAGLGALTEHASAKPQAARARSVLLVFTGGGVSQLDTFDMKPDAPEEIRGELRAFPARGCASICLGWPRWRIATPWSAACRMTMSITDRPATWR